jgi:hypothetical protein
MIRTRFAAASALLVGASLITAPGAAAAGDTVVYTVTSDAPLSDVSYTDGDSNLQIVSNTPSPWSVTFTVVPQPGKTQLLSVTGNTTGKQASCQISINGSVKNEQSNTGQNAKADCNYWPPAG